MRLSTEGLSKVSIQGCDARTEPVLVVRAFAKGVLRSSKTPEVIVTWDALPRTETGKLVRRDVLRLMEAGTGG